MNDTHDDKQRLQREKDALGTWRSMGEKYGVNHVYIYNYVNHGAMPPRKIARALGIVPASVRATRERNAIKKAIAASWGYASWSAFETEKINEWKEKHNDCIAVCEK